MASVNPTLSSLQEFILLYLKELAFYLLELKKLGIENKIIKENILETLSGTVIGAEYNEAQFQRLNSFLWENLTQAKTIYKDICQKHNLEMKTLQTYFKHKKNYVLSEVIKRGERFSLKKSAVFTPEQKSLFDIMLFLLKIMTIKILELKNLGHDNEEAYYSSLSLLNTMNIHNIQVETAKEEIEKFVKIFYEVVLSVYWFCVGKFGVDEPTEVSFSTRPGKAILVSGNDLTLLEKILIACEKENIDIYTHGPEMLVAHTFPKLRAYKNLVGHFGRVVGFCIVDLASFPGPILMTRYTVQKPHDFCKGNLYTTDIIPPQGAVKIIDDDFEPLIKAALDSKGFSTGIQKGSIMVGNKDKEAKEVLNRVLDDMEEGRIRHLYFVGVLNDSSEHSHYFDDFYNLVPDDCFVFSFSYEIEKQNVYNAKYCYDFVLFYKLLKEIEKRKPLREINMSIFLTKCDKNIIPNIINLKCLGIKNIFMCECPQTLVNPLLIDSIIDIFGLKKYSTPKEDIESTLQNG